MTAPSTRRATVESPTQVVLDDERSLVLRGADDDDLPDVQALHARCSPTTLAGRYLAGGRAPSRRLTRALLHTDLALVVTAAPGTVVALGNVAGADEDPQVAELACIVDDDWREKGVEEALLRQLVAGARLLGYREVVSIAPTTGGWVQQQISRLGPTLLQRTPFGEAVVRLELAPHHVGLLGRPWAPGRERVVVSRPGVA